MNRLVSQTRAPLTACHGPAGRLWQPVGGIVRRERSRELRFDELAPESSSFILESKNCENGFKTFEVIWIYYDRALNNLIMSYTIWKTKTRRMKCKSFHYLKFRQIKMYYIGNAKSRNFIGATHFHRYKMYLICWRILSQIRAQVVISYFLMLS